MIGQVAPANPAPPVFRSDPSRAPIDRLQRQLDLISAQPNRQIRQMTPIGQLGTRVDLLA
jgi:hypothetical protein